jgi:hypothetical protein
LKNILAFNEEPLLLVILLISDVGVCRKKVVIVSGKDVLFIGKEVVCDVEEVLVFKEELVCDGEEVLVFKEVVVGDGEEEVFVVLEFPSQLIFIDDIDNINGASSQLVEGPDHTDSSCSRIDILTLLKDSGYLSVSFL